MYKLFVKMLKIDIKTLNFNCFITINKQGETRGEDEEEGGDDEEEKTNKEERRETTPLANFISKGGDIFIKVCTTLSQQVWKIHIARFKSLDSSC